MEQLHLVPQSVSGFERDPFLNGYGYSTPFYVEYLGDYYKVEVVKQSAGISLQQVTNNGFISEEYVEVFTNKYKIITDIDLYVGYCIEHIDQYYTNKFVMSVFVISVKG